MKSPDRRIRRRPIHDQSFANYLPFGFHTTICLFLFFVTYATILLCLVPLLRAATIIDTTTDIANNHDGMNHHVAGSPFTYTGEHNGDALKTALDPLVESYQHFPKVLPGQILAEDLASVVKKRIFYYRQEEGYTDALLLKKAAAEFHHIRQQRPSKDDDHTAAAGRVELDTTSAAAAAADKAAPNGFVVLGMHRSGTSMLSGLLVTGMGYKTGGPLIGSAADNEKGFFERLDVVLQNDLMMNSQKVWWSVNVREYDPERALAEKDSGKVDFKKGIKALKFFNDPEHAPFLQKDPRMCITLKTWLTLMQNEPAAVFTYRHPLEVARSLKKREKGFTLDHGLRLWIVYNMRAIQNSADLCRVLSSNDAVLADPMKEVQRISDELTRKCRVPAPPRTLSRDDVEKFVDPGLQHNKKDKKDRFEVMDYGSGCVAREYDTEYTEGSDGYTRERGLYIKAMKMYCDFQSGKGFEADYEWPVLD
jgi:hypothetical protein